MALGRRRRRRAGAWLGWLLLAGVLGAVVPAGAAGEAGRRSFTDETGRAVAVPAEPRRIVPLTPSLVETVFALGLGERVVGVTAWSDHPPQAARLPQVGSYVAPNLEAIIALAPDLVLANREGNPPALFPRLAAARVALYVTDPADPAALPASLVRLGEVCGAPRAGRELAAALTRDFAEVARRVAGARPVPTLLVLTRDPLVSAGPASYSGRLLAMAGAKNVVPDGIGRWPRLAPEFVVSSGAELILVSTMQRGQELERELAYWRSHPVLARRPEFRVAAIRSDLLDRPGPRLGEGLRELARQVHPARFPE